MSLFFRKGLKLGPIRLNLSKSGIGVSAGVKGLRVGTGPRGTYVSAGKGGVYYRKSIHVTQQHAILNTAPIESTALSPRGRAKGKPIWFFMTVGLAGTCWLLTINGVSRDIVGAIAASAIVIGLIVWVTRRRMREEAVEQSANSNRDLLAASNLSEERRTLTEPKVVDAMAMPPEIPRKKPSLAELRGKDEGKKTDPSTTNHAWYSENYVLPGFDLLDAHDTEGRTAADPAELEQIQQTLIETLAQFGIAVAAGDITKGPTITRYEVYPAKGVRMDKIVALERDLARATSAERINILAPISGKDTVGIELANTRKVKVTLRELVQSQDWEEAKTNSKLPVAFGKDIYGKVIIADLAEAPHLLVAGMTGGGKSACLDAIIASLLFRFTPEELRCIMIDSKVVNMQVYNSLPHLVIPVVTDPRKSLLAMRWVINEMEKRYKIFARAGVRNITSFNGRPAKKTQKELNAVAGIDDPGPGSTTPPTEIKVPRDGDLVIPDRMPYIVIIIDELADLIQATDEFEPALERIAQVSGEAGIHLVLSSRTPLPTSSGVLKASIPSRIAFQVRGEADSYSVLDQNGADRLLGQGDMLYLPPSTSRLIRAQGVLVTDEEIHRLVEFVAAQSPPSFDLAMQDKLQLSSASAEEVTDEDEELVEKCLEIIRQEKRASTSLLQRRLRLGYTRAARIVDILEQRGILGPGEGAKPREILVDLDATV